MRRVGIGVLAVLVVAGAAYWGLGAYSDARLREALDQSIKKLPPGYAVTYKSATYSLIDGRAEITGVTVHAALAAGVFDGSIDHIDLAHPNLEAGDRWNEARADPAKWQMDQALPLADRVLIKGIHVASQWQTVDLDSEELDGGRVYPAALLHPGLPSVSDVLAGFKTGDEPSPETLLGLARLEASLALGLGYDRLEAVNMKASGRTLPGTPMPDQPFTYQVGRMVAEGLDRGVLKQASGDDIAFDGLGGSVKIAHIAVTGLDGRHAADQVLDATKLAPVLFDGFSIKNLDYAGIAVQQPSGGPIALDDFVLANVAVTQGEPVSGALMLKGLHLDPQTVAQPTFTDLAGQLGVDHMTIGLSFAFNRDIKTGGATIHDSYLRIDELGGVDLDATLTGDPIGGSPAGASLVKASLTYRDASLVDRVMRLMARGGDPETARSQLILFARLQGARLGPALAPAVDAVAAFLQKPGSLTFNMAPAEPVPLIGLAAARSLPPAQIATLVGLTVQANQ
jgi:hypothetical protein